MGDIKTEYEKLFIGGKLTEPSTSEIIEVHCPATGEYVGKVPMAAAADVDAAVAAARAAFDSGPLAPTPAKGGAQGRLHQAARSRDRTAADLGRNDAVDEWNRGDELLRRPRRRPGQVAG